MYLVGYAGVWGLVAGGAGEAGEAGGKRGLPHAATPCCHQMKKTRAKTIDGEKREGKRESPEKCIFL